jgi:hypothetical protein
MSIGGHEEGLANCAVYEDSTGLILVWLVSSHVPQEGIRTNGAGGKLAGSVSCGIEAHASTQWPFEGFG